MQVFIISLTLQLASPPVADAGAAGEAIAAVDEAARLVEVGANTKANLTRAIKLYRANLEDTSLSVDRRVTGYVDLARAHMRLGDLMSGAAEKKGVFERGREAALRAVELGPHRADAIAYRGFLTAKVGEARGIMNSLMMVDDVKRDMNTALRINPSYHYARTTLAVVYHALPGIAGGSDKKAKRLLHDTLAKQPRFTAAMKDLGDLHRDRGEDGEARRWYQAVLDEQRPARKNDHRKFDVPHARRELARLGRS
jgi:hypothetical protein